MADAAQTVWLVLGITRVSVVLIRTLNSTWGLSILVSSILSAVVSHRRHVLQSTGMMSQ